MNEEEKAEMLAKSRSLMSKEISKDMRKLFDKYRGKADSYDLHSIFAGTILMKILLNAPTLEEGIESLKVWTEVAIDVAKLLRKEMGRD